MLLSSGVIWRHASFEAFREECPDGDPALQRLVWDELPESLAWLEDLGVFAIDRKSRNPRTSGMRFDPYSLTLALARRSGRLRLKQPLRELPARASVILATGGFAANRDLVREHITPEADHLLLRATPWSTGDGLALGLEAGGRRSARLDELYGRNMPDAPVRIDESRFVPLAQLYAHHAVARSADGSVFESRSWSEIDVVQWTARQPGARARYVVDLRDLDLEATGGRTIRELVAEAAGLGAPVRQGDDTVSVNVVAGITTTLGGLAVDERACVVPGVHAAGGDVGGIANGGYASGLAAALVLGRVAARSALEVR